MKKLFVLCIVFILPMITNAEVIFSEVMYNPEGTDSGREWVEVYNSGSDAVDLTEYKLLENGTNHKVSAYNDGSTLLEPDSYAVIADNPEKLNVDHSISSIVLDTAFSLKNDGEEIQLIDPNGVSVDTVAFVPGWGGNGNGNSLQLNNDTWIPADPTPGSVNLTEAEDESEEGEEDSSSDDGEDSNSTHEVQVDLSDFKPKMGFEIYAGRERYALINTPLEFKIIHNLKEDILTEISWSFGDGGSEKGDDVRHIYYAPGVYNLVVNAKNSEEQAVYRTKVHVSEPNIDIFVQNSGKHVDLLLKNKSKKEINIGGFSVRTAEDKFRIPEDTIISGEETLILSHEITNMEFSRYIKVNYPNGRSYFRQELLGRYDDMYWDLSSKGKKAIINLILSKN